MKQILYLGWIGYGNLGDDLMWDIFKILADKYLDKNEYKITPSFPKVDLSILDPYDVIVLGGGSLMHQAHYIDILHTAMKKNKEIIIWGSGLDRIEKTQMESLMGKNPSSFKNFIHPEVQTKLVEIIDHANFVGVRGPLTYQVLKKIGADLKKIQISGDPGLLLQSNGTDKLSGPEIWNTTEKVIGLNWGTSNNKIYGKNELQVEDQLVPAVKKLIQKGYKIYMYRVWDKDKVSNDRLYSKLDDKDNVKMATKTHHQNELAQIIRNFHFTINLKLHANVISTTANVPFIALGYRFKIFDYAKSIDLDNLVIPTDSIHIEQEILDMERYIQENRAHILEKYIQYKTVYNKKLIIPFIKDFIS